MTVPSFGLIFSISYIFFPYFSIKKRKKKKLVFKYSLFLVVVSTDMTFIIKFMKKIGLYSLFGFLYFYFLESHISLKDLHSYN